MKRGEAALGDLVDGMLQLPFLEARTPAGRVVRAAVAARLATLALALAADRAAPDFDASASAAAALALPACPGPGAGSTPGPAWLEGLAVWDAAYFVRLCECGLAYEDERHFAFFPGLPAAMLAVRRAVLRPLGLEAGPLGGARGACVAAGLLVSNASFVAAAAVLLRLGRRLLGDAARAERAALLFCLPPASVFHSMVYTESLFALLTFLGLDAGFAGRPAAAAAWFALAGGVRSNGATLCAFLAFWHLHRPLLDSLRARRPPSLAALAAAAARLAAQSAVVLAPAAAFQAHAYHRFCAGGEGAVAAARRPWCERVPPSVYGYVQAEYWGVGFLRYWEAKQAPNFLLAAPALALAFAAAWRDAKGAAAAPWRAPFALHGLVLGAMGLLVINVQVATRLLAASPPLYWLAAGLEGRAGAAVRTYFALYAAVGVVLFVNHYPWT